MSRRAALIALLAAACGGVDRGPIDVYAFGYDGAAARELEIVFADVDGTSRSTHVDATGHVAGEVEAGGSVWAADLTAGNGTYYLTAYTDVQAGDAIRFGPDAPHPTVATITPTATQPAHPAPQGPLLMRSYSSCTPARYTTQLEPLAIDDQCEGSVDVMIVAIESAPGGERPYAYAYYGGKSIADSTLAVADADWKPLDRVSVELPAGHSYADLTIGGKLGPRISTSFASGTTITADVPAAGGLHIATRILPQDGRVAQIVSVDLPAMASQAVDLSSSMPPWVSVEGTSAKTWSADDDGGALRPDVLVFEHSWLQPLASFDMFMHVHLIGPVQPAGKVPRPELPDAFAELRPGADFMIGTNLKLVRFEGLVGDPLHTAERLGHHADSAYAIDLLAIRPTSAAFTGTY